MTKNTPIRDAAYFTDMSGPETAITALRRFGPDARGLIVSDEPAFLDAFPSCTRASFAQIGLEDVQVDAQHIIARLEKLPAGPGAPQIVITDMSWSTALLDADSTFETWSSVVEHLHEQSGIQFLSLYDRGHLVERQLQAVLRSHQQFLAPSGVYENPFWLPSHLRFGAGIDDQLTFLLGRVVPDFAHAQANDPEGRGFARGASPPWLAKTPALDITGRSEARWQIRCLGPLRVYQGGHLINWKIPGGSAQKTRALFCYLLQSGEKGAQADRISELIWPDDVDEVQKRARLHHAVAMLRKTLGGKATVQRVGTYYALASPPGSWTDISAFEQACRRGLRLAKEGDGEAALRHYRPAERLYAGDLFEDIPVAYTHNDLEDWCRPQRRWLREMVAKLLRDMSSVLRSLGQDDEALEKCQKALNMDLTNEASNMEMLHVLHAQSRFEAVDRQYEQYLSVIDQSVTEAHSTAIHKLYRRLTM